MIDNDRFQEEIENLPDHHVISFRNTDLREDVEQKISSLKKFICPMVFIRCNIKWARFFGKFTNLYPGVLGNPLDIKPSNYRKWVTNSSLMVNSWVDFTTWGFLRDQKNYWMDRYEGKFFIKPDSGTKIFTGQVLTEENFDFEHDFITKQNFVDDSQRVMVAEAFDIKEELRGFYIKNTQIGTSTYSWEDNPPEYKHLIELMKFSNSTLLKEFPLGYTMDFGIVDGVPKIIELNSLTCSGVYDIDIGDLIIRLEEETLKKISGGMSDIL